MTEEKKQFEDNKVLLWGERQASKKLLDQYDEGNKNPRSVSLKAKADEKPTKTNKSTVPKAKKVEKAREFNIDDTYTTEDLDFLNSEYERLETLLETDPDNYDDIVDLQGQLYDLIEGLEAMKEFHKKNPTTGTGLSKVEKNKTEIQKLEDKYLELKELEKKAKGVKKQNEITNQAIDIREKIRKLKAKDLIANELKRLKEAYNDKKITKKQYDEWVIDTEKTNGQSQMDIYFNDIKKQIELSQKQDIPRLKKIRERQMNLSSKFGWDQADYNKMISAVDDNDYKTAEKYLDKMEGIKESGEAPIKVKVTKAEKKYNDIMNNPKIGKQAKGHLKRNTNDGTILDMEDLISFEKNELFLTEESSSDEEEIPKVKVTKSKNKIVEPVKSKVRAVKGSEEAKEIGRKLAEARKAKSLAKNPNKEIENKQKEEEKEKKAEDRHMKKKPWYYIGDIPKGYREATEEEAIENKKVSIYGKYQVDGTRYRIYREYGILLSKDLSNFKINLFMNLSRKKALKALEDIEIIENKIENPKNADRKNMFENKLEVAIMTYKDMSSAYNWFVKFIAGKSGREYKRVKIALPPKPEIKFTKTEYTPLKVVERPIDPRTGKPAKIEKIENMYDPEENELVFKRGNETAGIKKKHFDDHIRVKNLKTAMKLLKKGILLESKHYKKDDLDNLAYVYSHMSGKGIIDIMGIKPFQILVGGLSSQAPPNNPIGKQVLTSFSESAPITGPDIGYKSGIDYTKTVVYGRDDFPPKVRKIIKEYGDKPVSKLTIVRHPLADWTVEALNAASFGEFKKRYDNEPYEKLYHLGLLINFTDGSSILIEKNEVINAVVNPNIPQEDEEKPIKHFPQGLTLNIMLEGAKERLGYNLYKYNAGTNNCQSFVNSLIYKFSDVEEDRFVKQNTEQLFKGQPGFTKLVNSVTDLGAKVNEITEGTGLLLNNAKHSNQVQSVLFKKPYPLHIAKNWLHKHDFNFNDVDSKPEHWRFRQIEPNNKYKYRTHPITEKISLIIAY